MGLRDADPDDADDLARQRRKRAARRLDQRAEPCTDATFRDVVVATVAAIEESGGRVDVRRYLTTRGYGAVVVDEVVAYLDIEHAHPSSRLFD
jgi:hypothetical protein